MKLLQSLRPPKTEPYLSTTSKSTSKDYSDSSEELVTTTRKPAPRKSSKTNQIIRNDYKIHPEKKRENETSSQTKGKHSNTNVPTRTTMKRTTASSLNVSHHQVGRMILRHEPTNEPAYTKKVYGTTPRPSNGVTQSLNYTLSPQGYFTSTTPGSTKGSQLLRPNASIMRDSGTEKLSELRKASTLRIESSPIYETAWPLILKLKPTSIPAVVTSSTPQIVTFVTHSTPKSVTNSGSQIITPSIPQVGTLISTTEMINNSEFEIRQPSESFNPSQFETASTIPIVPSTYPPASKPPTSWRTSPIFYLVTANLLSQLQFPLSNLIRQFIHRLKITQIQ